jgi:hypothetical protein
VTRKQFTVMCETRGTTFKDDGTSLHLEAPRGYLLSGPRVHSVRIDYNSPPGAWKKTDAFDALADDLHDGIEPCDIDECDYCQESER